MQIVRLELFGFKSFMDRTVLPLGNGITGVVGPNGCGKSNVVDATRWVLGETRARSLRGDLLEDVIFNGTDRLRPLGLAEVSLTLRSEDKDFFADLVSPTTEADLFMMSEELAAEAEEKKVASLVSGDESNKKTEGSNIIPIDGQQSEQASNSEEILEQQLEAGCEESGYNAKPVASAALLQKFSWLKSVNEVQITRRLYRSGESEFFLNRVPCRLKDLREFCRAIGMGPRAYTIVAQGEITRIVTAKADERRAILEEAAGVQGFRDKIVAAKKRLEDTDLNIARLTDIITEVSKQVAVLKRQAAKARNRQQLKEEIRTLDITLFIDKLCLIDAEQKSISAQLESAGNEELELSELLSAKQDLEEEARSELMNIDFVGDELRGNIDRIKEELAARDRARGERLAKIGELKALLAGAESELQNLRERKLVLDKRKIECKNEILALQQQSSDLEAERSSIEHSSGGEVARLGEILEEKREGLRENEFFLRELRDELVATRATYDSLSEQLVDEAPTERLMELLRENSHNEVLPANVQLLIDGITVPDYLARALQAVFQERATYFVVNEPHKLMRELQDLQDKGLPVGIGAFNKAFICEDIAINSQISFKPLYQHLEVQEDFKLLVSHILRNVYVAASIDEASSYFSGSGKDDFETVLVTPNGFVITNSSFYELAGETGIIQTRNKVQKIASKLSECEQKHKEAEQEYERLRFEIATIEKEQLFQLSESEKVQAKILELSSKAGQIQGRLDGLYGALNTTEQDLEVNEEKTLDVENRLDALQYRLDSAEEELENDSADQDSLLEDELSRYSFEYDGLERRRQEKRLQMNDIMRSVEDLRQQVDALRIKGAGLELKKQKNDLAIENVKERVFTDYGEDEWSMILEKSLSESPLEDFIREELEQNLSKNRIKLLKEGDVDPESINRLEEETGRLEQLEQQREDLEKASRILKRTISRLTETSIERFMATFAAVRADFERLIPQLFNGGRGTLELTDPSNPLESGLELTVRPPGKKLKSIELLSGGEKGLCAAALIFSMFLQRPSPLCILDEVDAPFDEVNLSRFIALIKEISARTQFLMITHNKQSMAVCDNLVGVTMQEPGASKILTVSLEEAIEQVA